MKLTDIVTSALAVFETNKSKTLNDGKIDEKELNVLQAFHVKTLNKLPDINHKMGAGIRNHFEKVYWRR